ncbi:ubiquinone/menaquinone biosynthesis C-methyltransferase UbiE-like [Asterias rubens]|uniref:ubiquinone/menaquinone biosynthesis C-methyltransferase UbiE-like n=1 Tax=Asterias rubens TaxID=7604 RepID=UPI0014559093|nr:ubiquinone/menaquinone biosynthesis C-methyltransferase UbiE-like [Asterias rubens]
MASGAETETATEFTSRVTQQLVGGIAGIGLAMGMETGLFDVMISMGGNKKTSQEIADLAGMKERYVREWLGCMAAANIVNFDPKEGKFWLPSHRSNIIELKGLAMTLPILYGGFLKVAECFRKDGPTGVPFEKYHKLDDLIHLTQGRFCQDQLLQEFLPSMPQLHRCLETGIHVLDLGCGEGTATITMARRFSKSRFYGLDISQPALRTARYKAAEMGLSNVEFVKADISLMPTDWTDKFDYLFVHFVLHDLSYPTKALREMHRVLKPGGTLSVIEINAYSNLEDNLERQDRKSIVLAYSYSLVTCLPISLCPGDGAGLGGLWGREEAQKALEQAKFQVVSVTEASTGCT